MFLSDEFLNLFNDAINQIELLKNPVLNRLTYSELYHYRNCASCSISFLLPLIHKFQSTHSSKQASKLCRSGEDTFFH